MGRFMKIYLLSFINIRNFIKIHSKEGVELYSICSFCKPSLSCMKDVLCLKALRHFCVSQASLLRATSISRGCRLALIWSLALVFAIDSALSAGSNRGCWQLTTWSSIWQHFGPSCILLAYRWAQKEDGTL